MADGSHRIRLTDDSLEVSCFSWSPDGEWLAFEAELDGKSDIYVVKVNGGQIERLTNDPGESCCPAWSPDGQRIAFLSKRHSRDWGLFLMNADGSDIIELTDSNLRVSRFSWSPDSKRLAFAAEGEEQSGIYVVGTGKDQPIRLTDNLRSSWSPAWSPDGQHIAYMSEGRLVVMDSEGGHAEEIAVVSTSDYPPRWSPDSRRLLFMSWNGNFEIYAVNADGSDFSQLTVSRWSQASPPPISAWSVEPEWSPDGRYITFMGYQNNDITQQVYVMRADGSQLHLLTHEQGLNPAWSPDGNRIAFISRYRYTNETVK